MEPENPPTEPIVKIEEKEKKSTEVETQDTETSEQVEKSEDKESQVFNREEYAKESFWEDRFKT